MTDMRGIELPTTSHTNVNCSLNGAIDVTVQAKPISRPWWNYVRLSVRALIVLVLLIGAGLGWMVRSARIQRDAVAAIEKAGGWVKYDWECSNRNDIPGGKPWAPGWLVDLIGVDFFGHVTAVWFNRGAADDAAIVELGRLSQLQSLDLAASPVSDAGLAHLKRLPNLSSLKLCSRNVSDTGLAHLKGFTHLAELDLSGTQITDAGLAHLKGLTKLSELDLSRVGVTDAGLAHLKGMTKLAVLYLMHNQVSDAGLAYLTGLSSLSYLDLGGTQVTDTGIQELQKAFPNAEISR
jgi:internalin A